MARWSDLATWRGPSVNSGDGDGKPLEAADAVTEVRGLVVHIAEGFFEGTVSWQKNADANTSSHFITGRAGGRAQMVDTHDRAWTQSSGNSRWLSVECEGFTLGHKLYRQGWHQLTPQQIEFIAQLFARIHTTYGVPLQLTNHPNRPGLGYHSMGAENGIAWGHSDCPGEPIKAQLPAVLARAIHIVHGGALAGGDDMSDAYNLLDGLNRTQGNDTYTPDGADGARYGSLSNASAIATIQKAATDARLAADAAAEIKAKVDKLAAPQLTPEQLAAIATQAGEHAAALIGGKLDALLAEVRRANDAERAGLQAELDRLKQG